MTHLRIELNNILENVSSAVIKKLYELATSGDLDLNSNLAGVVSIPGGYVIWKNTLETMFPDFHLTMDREYVPFNDPAFEAACVANFSSDGIGMTMADFLAVTDESPLSAFNDNTEITDMTEFKYFTNMQGHPMAGDNGSRPYPLSGLTNLHTIEFPNQILYFGRVAVSSSWHSMFYNTNNLLNVKFPNNLEFLKLSGAPEIIDLRNTKLDRASILTDSAGTEKEVYFPNTVERLYVSFFSASNSIKKIVIADGGTTLLQYYAQSGYGTVVGFNAQGVTLDMPSNLVNVHKSMFNKSDNRGYGVQRFILRATTPPAEVTGENTLTASTDPMNLSQYIDLYVPDESISAYQSNSIYSSFKHIYGLSLLPSDYSPTPSTNNA